MATRLREVVVAQHRRLLTIIDRAESSPDDASIRRVHNALSTHLDVEEQDIYPLSEPLGEGSRYGHEEHAVLRFALDRIGEAKTADDRGTRLRVLRDLFVRHLEREEWVTLQLLESRLDETVLGNLRRKLEAAFGTPKKNDLLPHPAQARRKER